MQYIKYLRYVLRHKLYVMLECFEKGQFWLGITHDMSKFLPSEFIPYARYFYGYYPSWDEVKKIPMCTIKTKEDVSAEFDIAWLKHIHRNKHHWQYWLLREDDSGVKTLQMPNKYVDEMLSDWNGAGKAINGKVDTRNWYIKNKENIHLHPATKHCIETCLNLI